MIYLFYNKKKKNLLLKQTTCNCNVSKQIIYIRASAIFYYILISTNKYIYNLLLACCPNSPASTISKAKYETGLNFCATNLACAEDACLRATLAAIP